MATRDNHEPQESMRLDGPKTEVTININESNNGTGHGEPSIADSVTEAIQAANEQVAASPFPVFPATARVIPRYISDWYEVDEEEYPGHMIKSWLNIPGTVIEDLGSGEDERIRRGVLLAVREHNGWREVVLDPETGEPIMEPQVGPDNEPLFDPLTGEALYQVKTEALPPASDWEFYRRIPTRLAGLIIQAVRARAMQNPNSPKATLPQ